MTQRPRYLLGSTAVWVTFFMMKLFDDYDGFMSIIGAPIVATFLTAIVIPAVLIVGLIRSIPGFSSVWYSGTKIPTILLLTSLGVLAFGHSVGLQEPYTYTNSLGDKVDATRLNSLASVPAFFVACFCVFFWPSRRTLPIIALESDAQPQGGT